MPAIPTHHTATVDEAWDGPGAVAAMPAEYADLYYCHGWWSQDAADSSHKAGDDDVDDKKLNYKFPHHRTKGGPANLAACRNGLARLDAADVPDADRTGIKAHLQAHLDDGDSDADNTAAHGTIRAIVGEHGPDLANLPARQAVITLSNLNSQQRAQRRVPRTHRLSDRDEFFRITDASGNGTPARLDLFDEIGFWGVDASDFAAQLQAINGDRLVVHVNSPGGDAFDGLAIMNLLRAHPASVDVVVDGLAASAASYISMGGDTLTMMPGSEMMIHDASGICMGNPADMQSMADLLGHVSNNIASIYAARAGGTIADWRAQMGKETWYTADEAVAAGLADKVGPTRGKAADPDLDEPASGAANGWNLTFYAYSGRADAPAPTSPVRSDADGPPTPTAPAAPADTQVPEAPQAGLVALTDQQLTDVRAALRGAFATPKEARP